MATAKFVKLDPGAKIPTYNNKKDSGMDLYALEDYTVTPGVVTKVRTGIAIQMPEGYEGQVRSRSGNAAKFGLSVLNSPGTIDESYRGEICVLLIKSTFEYTDFVGLSGTLRLDPHKGKAGDKIAQFVIKAIEYHDIVEIEEFDAPETDRGAKGFGSSGV